MVKMKVLVSQSCSILSDPKYCSLPGSAVSGILQARILCVYIYIYIYVYVRVCICRHN